jgi:integrase
LEGKPKRYIPFWLFKEPHMPRLTHKVPSYRHHRASGQAVVTLNGRDHYLGPHGSQESQEVYRRVLQEWLSNDRHTPTSIGTQPATTTIDDLVVAFWHHAESYYVKDGRPTREQQALGYSLKPLVKLYGSTPVKDFGPRRLKAVRQKMIDDNLARTLINKRVMRIRQVFKWGVENELVESSVLYGLKAVAPLKRGRSNVRESDPVKPVPVAILNATKPYLSRQIGAMVDLQILTGMRPGEVLQMRRGDLDTTDSIWIYHPGRHKTEHHGHERSIFIGPQAQQILMPLMNRAPDDYMFSPQEAESERREKLSRQRKTPMSCGNRPGTNRKRHPRRRPRSCYDGDSYRRAIYTACDKAFPPPEPLCRKVAPDGQHENHKAWIDRLTKEQHAELKTWQKDHRWHPHQLRHNAATYFRKEFGIEAARVVLGHKSAGVTEIYAELDRMKAAEIMGRVG